MKKLLMIMLLMCIVPFASAELLVSDVEVFTFGAGVPNNDASVNGAVAIFKVENVGDTVETGLFELAFMPRSSSLSFFSDRQVCNVDTPYNVHKTYSIPPGESQLIDLSNQPRSGVDEFRSVPDGTYRIVLTHATKCYDNTLNGDDPDQSRSKEPFGWEHLLGVQSFGDADANEFDQCDTDFHALNYVQKNGYPACVSATCVEPFGPDSVARCDVVSSDEQSAGFNLVGLGPVIIGFLLVVAGLFIVGIVLAKKLK